MGHRGRKEALMKVYELCFPGNMKKLTPEQQKFFSKMILHDCEKYAVEHNITPQLAYEFYSRGTIGGDREIGEVFSS